ncbi:GNAT family N-acetyltransferase [Novosphingobium mangrovi (ex Huang et al. 2023)]|uniref:GNAT family N-acetyltransferase n=1 Tax=Novosphingobium mangrovi (ex Huang et al. 2023) TaxID=2976432 RepID=A0ABT2IAT4_9SPHN|nr:N-acetyltransferase [Novosphingobium mangrovi (ex Huang et al. 2023)]MCT2401884.1 GNAT family N-acetyltransferase [Novosphingobium mangrovi (ex Huang et al. 2023)]
MSLSATCTLTTRSGIDLDVRPATESDEPALAAFFDRVNDDDRRFRFLTAADHVSHEQLEPLVHTDHFRTESWLGINAASGEIVASGLLACDGPLDTCEIAISVCANYRGKGIGWALLDYLAKQAEARGCRRAISIESRDNHAAIELEREKGFVPEPFDGDPTLVVLSKTFR